MARPGPDRTLAVVPPLAPRPRLEALPTLAAATRAAHPAGSARRRPRLAAAEPLDPPVVAPPGSTTAGARSRHPSGRDQRIDLVGAVAPIVRLLRRTGAPHPTVGAATVAARGAQGRSTASFAAAYGLPAGLVEALESGRVPADALPLPLRVLTPIASIEAGLRTGR